MAAFRTFRNTDPPLVAAVWRSCAGQPGLVQPVSVDLLEQCVFAKLYFDYQGLVLAFDDGRPVGFAHAGFGPNEREDGIATEKGVICVVLTRPDCRRPEIVEGLLERCEDYLRRRGAKVVFGGAIRPINPFYLGLYGGSELPGVLESDVVARDLFASHGYDAVDRTLLFRLQLADWRAPVDRQQVQLRRQMIVQLKMDPPARSWWEACTTGDFDLARFEATERGSPTVLALATFRAMEPTQGGGLGRVLGLLDVEVIPSHRRQGLGTFLLAESCRQLARQGITAIEAQATEQNPPSERLLRKLGMSPTARGIVYCKKLR